MNDRNQKVIKVDTIQLIANTIKVFNDFMSFKSILEKTMLVFEELISLQSRFRIGQR